MLSGGCTPDTWGRIYCRILREKSGNISSWIVSMQSWLNITFLLPSCCSKVSLKIKTPGNCRRTELGLCTIAVAGCVHVSVCSCVLLKNCLMNVEEQGWWESVIVRWHLFHFLSFLHNPSEIPTPETLIKHSVGGRLDHPEVVVK